MGRPSHWMNLTLILVSLSSLGASTVHFEQVRSENDAASDVITALLQDSSGFIWIGSREGLTLYDGYTFTTFVHDPSDPTSISDNVIRTLFEDRKGNLWIGTNTGGLNRLDRNSYRFVHYRHDSTDPGSLSHDSVYTIAEANDGDLWIGTQKGLNEFNPGTGRSKRFTAGAGTGHLSNDYVTALLVDGEVGLWVGTVDGGLNHLDTGTGRFAVYRNDPTQPRSLGNDKVFALLATPAGDLMVGTEDGFFLMNRSTHAFQRFVPARGETGVDELALVTCLAPAAPGKVWVGTHGDGLLEADMSSLTFHSIKSDMAAIEGIGAARLISLLKDRAGALWIGTWGGGLRRLTESAMQLASAARGNQPPPDLVDRDVTGMGIDRAGGLWVGTRSGLLLRKDPVTSVWSKRSIPGDPTILQMTEGPDGSVWVGSSIGLSRITPATGQMTSYRHRSEDPASLGPGYVAALLVDRDRHLWVGTGEGGVQRIDNEGHVLKRFLNDPANPESLSDNYVTALHQDQSGRLWVGTRSGGLNAIDLSTGRVARYVPQADLDCSISHHHVTSIHQDAKGRLWVGTGGGGLNRVEGLEEPDGIWFTRYSRSEGLADSNVMAILEDDDGALWISTKRGLSRFEPERALFTNFFVSDSLPSSEFEPGAATRAGAYLLFGSVKWVAAIDAGTPLTQTVSAPTIITSIRTATGDIRAGKPTMGLSRIEIPYGDWLSIELAVLDYNMPGAHAYAYRLGRGEDSWVDLGAHRAITFSKLPPGRYDFVAKGRGRQSIFSETAPALTITIVPPFWMTLWFRLLAGFGLLCTAVVIHRVRLSAVERRNRALTTLQSQREMAREELAGAYDRLTLLTRRLEAAKEEERKTIARELHDEMGPALTAVVINLQLLGAGNDQSKSARRITDAIEIVDRMVQKIRDVSLDLRPPLLDEMGLVAALKGYLETQAERTGIQIDVHGAPDVRNLPSEVEITAFRVAQEAVTNVIRHAAASHVIVTISQHDGRVEITVQDDGRGFNVQATMEGLSTGKTLGLLGMQERVRMMGGEFHIESAAGRGTRVHVSVPAGGIS